MPTADCNKNQRRNDKIRKKGETVRAVVCLLCRDPALSVRALARWIEVGEDPIRTALRRIQEEPERVAALMGVSPEEIAWALAARDEIARERKRVRQAVREAEKAEKRKEKEFRRLNAEYQKANPALKKGGQIFPKNAPKKPFPRRRTSISAERCVEFCQQAYRWDGTGRYVFDQSRCGRRPSDIPKYVKYGK